jgi:thiamine pyrophosphate-dependent acetolactate synthase large subunit-like protein
MILTNSRRGVRAPPLRHPDHEQPGARQVPSGRRCSTKPYSETSLGRRTDYVRLAEAFGGKGQRILEMSTIGTSTARRSGDGRPVVVDCVTEATTTSFDDSARRFRPGHIFSD